MVVLALFDIIPPLPSLWGVLLVVLAFFLYQKKGVAWAAIPGVLGGIALFGWLMSLFSWAMSLVVTFAIVALLFFAGKAVVNNFRNKNVKKGTATEHKGSIGSGGDLDDIDALLAQTRESVARSQKM